MNKKTEKKEESAKKVKKRQKRIKGNKALIIGIVGLIIGIVGVSAGFFFGLNRERKEPVYSVSSSEIILEALKEEENLKIFWEDKQIETISLVRVAIANRGRIFIDKDDILEPIKIKPNKFVDILKVRIPEGRKSRDELNFNTQIKQDKDGIQSIMVTINGNELLESKDGAIFYIMYEGSQICEWEVTSRIKGASRGFRRVSHELLAKKRSLAFSLILILILIAIGYVLIYRSIRSIMKGFTISWFWLFFGLLFFILLSISLKEDVLLWMLPVWMTW